MKASSLIFKEAAAVRAQALSQTDQEVASPRVSLRYVLDLNSWFDCPRAAEIALGILEALDDNRRSGARQVGLQPENVFVSDEGKVFIDEAVSCIAAQYLSPEEARGEPAGERSDLYALGVVLYEMLTDRVPFEGNDPTTIKHKHLYRWPEPPQVFRADVTAALSNLVMRLLVKDPAGRPSRIEVSAELRRIIATDAGGVGKQSFADTTISDASDSDDLMFDDTVSDSMLADRSPAVRDESARATDEIGFVFDLEGMDFEDEWRATALVSDAVMSGPVEQAFVQAPPTVTSGATPAVNAAPSSGSKEKSCGVRSRHEVDVAADSREWSTAPADALAVSSTASMERDPFDLPTVILPTVIADELPAKPSGVRRMRDRLKQLAGSMRWRRERFRPILPNNTRRRLLKIVLSAILVSATLHLYEPHEMSSTKPNEAAAPFGPLHALSPSLVGAVPGKSEIVGPQSEAASGEAKPLTQTGSQTQTNYPVGAPPASSSPARTDAAVNVASSARTTSLGRRLATARRQPRRPSSQQGQRRHADYYRPADAKGAGTPVARAVNYKNENRKRKAPPVKRRKRAWRRPLYFQERQR
ncbi:MAG: protein kinase domain-containing protein [Blastocatellia bacterium]